MINLNLDSSNEFLYHFGETRLSVPSEIETMNSAPRIQR